MIVLLIFEGTYSLLTIQYCVERGLILFRFIIQSTKFVFLLQNFLGFFFVSSVVNVPMSMVYFYSPCWAFHDPLSGETHVNSENILLMIFLPSFNFFSHTEEFLLFKSIILRLFFTSLLFYYPSLIFSLYLLGKCLNVIFQSFILVYHFCYYNFNFQAYFLLFSECACFISTFSSIQ